MNKLFLFCALLLAGCVSATTPVAKPATIAVSLRQSKADKAAIQAYLKETLDDPASYQPVEFKAYGWQSRTDSLTLRQLLAGEAVPAEAVVPDTTTAGRLYFHKYRERNKAGGLVLTWENFVVYRNGKVVGIGLRL